MLIFVFLLSLLVTSVTYAGQEEFYQEVAASDENTTVTIVLVQSNNLAHSVTIVNDPDSTDEVYYDTSDGVASTSSARLQPGESRTINSGGGKFPITQIGLICDAAETATVRVFALPSY